MRRIGVEGLHHVRVAAHDKVGAVPAQELCQVPLHGILLRSYSLPQWMQTATQSGAPRRAAARSAAMRAVSIRLTSTPAGTGMPLVP